MEHSIIAVKTDLAYSAGANSMATINDLTPGAVAFIVDGTTYVTAAMLENTGTPEHAASVASLAGYTYMQIAFGTSNGTILSKRMYRGSNLILAGHQPYEAPKAEVMYIGDNNSDAYDLNLPTTLVAGTVASITLTEQVNNYIDSTAKRATYSYTVKNGDTKADVLAGLVALITAGDIATPVAIGSGTANQGIKLTCKTTGLKMGVALGGILADADVITFYNANGIAVQGAGDTNLPVNPYKGQGTAAQVIEDVNYWSALLGNTARVSYSDLMFTSPFGDLTGLTFQCAFASYFNPDVVYPANTAASVPQMVKLYIEPNVTALDHLLAGFGGFFGVDIVASNDTTTHDEAPTDLD